MKILHLCWGLEPNNGAANIARLIMGEQASSVTTPCQGNEVRIASKFSFRELREADELWCHCGWYPRIWLAVAYLQLLKYFKRLKPSKPIIKWMPECCYDPLRVRYHGWKKRLVGPIERWALRKVDAIVATCAAEGEWCRAYIGKGCPPIEVTDVKRFFDLSRVECGERVDGPLHVLYLGRRHPLKGVEYLEAAVRGLDVELRIVSDHTGEELEKDWVWCDVMCLPTLSDNFGLVIAEALERGKRVITTDGAPAWEGYPGVAYLVGYRDGSDETRVRLLKEAISRVALYRRTCL